MTWFSTDDPLHGPGLGLTGQAGFAVCAADLIQGHEFNGGAQGIADCPCRHFFLYRSSVFCQKMV